MKKIFIHGWGFSKKIWKDYLYLDDAVFVDLPSHGEDRRDDVSIHKFVEEVASVVREPSVLIGWSLGATVSVLASLKNPDIKELVLIGFSPRFSDRDFGSEPKVVKAFMHNLYRDFEKTVVDFRKTATGLDCREHMPQKDGATDLLRQFIELDITDILRDVRSKTFLIHGINDKIVNPQATLYSHEKIKDSEVILLNSHHGPFLEWDIFEVIDD